MLTKVHYNLKDVMIWTWRETAVFTAFATLVVVLYHTLGLSFLSIPWTPVALIGTAVAFIVGFQNNSAYGRIWEARKIWGGVVNTSRTWGMQIRDMVSNDHTSHPLAEKDLEDIRRGFVLRHIAWMTALRYAMRTPKSWETFYNHTSNKKWMDVIRIEEWSDSLEDILSKYLPKNEVEYVMTKKNKAAAILYLQSSYLKKYKDRGIIWEFSFLQLEQLLEEMFTLQGKSERIKNFPYPRQYATLSHYFVRLFIVLLPFSVIPQFANIGADFITNFPIVADAFVWVAIPFCVMISWVFHTMEKIGRAGENPFEGTANDVPITSISRGIEIDLLQLYDTAEDNIPKQYPEQKNTQF